MGLTRIRAEQISDIDYKQAVRVITLANITLSGGAPAEVDGVSLVTGDRVLVAGQSNAAQNGLYQVEIPGQGENGTWVRTSDANQDGEIQPGMIVMVTQGTEYADTPWKLITNGEIIIGTTELTFEENYSLAFGNIFANGTAVIANAVSAGITFEAGNNVSIMGNNTTKTVTIEATGGGGGTPGGANTEVQFNDEGSFGATAGFTFDKTTNAVATTGSITATGNITGSNLITSGQTVTVGVTSIGNITSTGAINSFGDLVGNVTFAAVPTRSLNLVGTSAVMKVARTTGTGDPAVELQALVPGNAAILTYWDFFASGSLDNFTLRRRTGGSNESLLTANSAGVQFPTGAVSVTGNITGGNLRTASVTIGNGPISGVTTISATGNANVGNLGAATVTATTLTGTLSTAAQTNITSVGTLGSLTVTGNVSGGNLITAGAVTGNGRALTSLNASNLDTGTVASGRLTGSYSISVTSATTAGTVTTAAQPNITSVGTLGSLAVTGNTTSGNFIGTLNGSGANISTINATNISSGTLAQARLANAAVTLGSTPLTLGATVTTVAGLSSVTSTTFVGALTGAATTAGTVTTAAQPNITSVGTLGSLAVTGNTTSGNFIGTLNGSGANVNSISATNISSGTLAQARLANASVTLGSTALTLGATVTTVAGLSSVTSTTFVGALTGAATTAGTVTTAAQPNITSVGTLTDLAVTGNITGGDLLPAADNTGVVGTAALTWNNGQFSSLTVDSTLNVRAAIDLADSDILRFGSSDDTQMFYNGTTNLMNIELEAACTGLVITDNATTRFTFDKASGNLTATNFLGIASSAKYADLAERYQADQPFEPGTVVIFGGRREVTITAVSHDTRIAGVISTNPAYLMNSDLDGEHVVEVALVGRVPVKVVGKISKGDRLVASDIAGVATCLNLAQYQPGCVIGKSLEDFSGDIPGVIEAVVGRL